MPMRAMFEHGALATSMRDICKQAKLSAGAVYRYFASKDALLAGFAEDHHGDDFESLLQAARRVGTP